MYWKTKAEALEAVKRDYRELGYAGVFKSDFDVVALAVAQNGHCVSHASTALQANDEIARIALATNGASIRWFSDVIKANRELALIAVESEGSALQYLPEAFRDDPEIVSTAIRHSKGCELMQFVSPRLCSDKDFMLPIVARDSSTFKFCSESLRADYQVAYEAIKKSESNLKHVSSELKSNQDLVKMAVSKQGEVFQYASPESRSNPHIVLAALENLNPWQGSTRSIICKNITDPLKTEIGSNDPETYIRAMLSYEALLNEVTPEHDIDDEPEHAPVFKL